MNCCLRLACHAGKSFHHISAPVLEVTCLLEVAKRKAPSCATMQWKQITFSTAVAAEHLLVRDALYHSCAVACKRHQTDHRINNSQFVETSKSASCNRESNSTSTLQYSAAVICGRLIASGKTSCCDSCMSVSRSLLIAWHRLSSCK